MGKLNNYFKESVAELKKVTWPSKKETYRYTLLILGISLLIAIFLGTLDFIFNLGFTSLIK
jgi:preprotein translocase subunit SecE